MRARRNVAASHVQGIRPLTKKRRLGLILPNQEQMMRAIPLSVLLTGKVPRHPVVEDHYTQVNGQFKLYQNDRYSNCGPVAIANQRGLITTYLGTEQKFPSQEEVFDLYSRSSIPSFNLQTGANDNGIVMQNMCKELVREGIAGTKAVAYARVNLFNLEEVSAAVSIFGSVLLGVGLRAIQEEQMKKKVWDYVWNSPFIGGHAILGVGYDKRNLKTATGNVVTWGEVVQMSLAFMQNQMLECWVVIWPENLGTKQFQDGINLDMIKEAYFDVTETKLVLP
jgi:hypothetical protein